MIDGIRRRLTRLEAVKPDPMSLRDIRKASDAALEAYIIASDIERRKAAGLPAVDYHRPLSDAALRQFAGMQ